jgi:hypothetical protein
LEGAWGNVVFLYLQLEFLLVGRLDRVVLLGSSCMDDSVSLAGCKIGDSGGEKLNPAELVMTI